MELIYLYVKSYENSNKLNKNQDSDNKDFSIKDTGFNFSDSFNCSFNKIDGLKIEKKDPVLPNFYGENIKGIRVLAGRNGSGKTTILDLIGMTRGERFKDHYYRDIDDKYFTAEYFFIYHMKDNDFLIEIVGNMVNRENCWIKNLDLDSVYVKDRKMHDKLPIGYIFNYIFDKNKMTAQYKYCFSKYSFKDSEERAITDHANIYYFSNSFSHRRSNGIKDEPRQDIDSNYLLKRQKLNNGINEPRDYHAIYKMLFSKKYKDFIDKTIDTSLSIQITDSYSNDLLLDRAFNGRDNNKKARELLEDLKSEIDGFARELYKNNNLTYNEGLNVIETEKVINSYSDKQKYLLDLTCRYVLYSLESLISMICGKSYDFSFKKTHSKLSKTGIENYLHSIKNNEYILYDSEPNPFKELLDVKTMLDIFYKKDDIGKEVYESINKKYFYEVDEVDKVDIFHENITNNIILGRYLLMRIETQVTLGENTRFQASFEEVLIQLLKLDDSYFCNNGIIIKSKVHDYDSNVDKLFEIVDKWYRSESYNDIWNKFNFAVPYSSDGEGCILDIFSKFINILENEERSLHIIVMDEPDQRLHPEWARQFIKLMVDTIRNLYESNYKPLDKELNIQLIISTHSPFVLSDIRSEDLILLDSNPDKDNTLSINTENINTFSANIYDILNNSFFLEDTTGEFAKNKIETSCSKIFSKNKHNFIEAVKSGNITDGDLKKLKYLINQISEPILNKSLTRELEIRDEWLKESDSITKTDSEVNHILEKFSNLSDDKKKEFIRRLISSEGGESYD